MLNAAETEAIFANLLDYENNKIVILCDGDLTITQYMGVDRAGDRFEIDQDGICLACRNGIVGVNFKKVIHSVVFNQDY